MRVTWYFGDGQSSRENEPVHVYRLPGVYTPGVIVATDEGGYGNTYGSVDYGTENYKGEGDPFLDFYAVPLVGNGPLRVQFRWIFKDYGRAEKVDYIRVLPWSVETGGLNVSKTDKCLRYAMNRNRGLGWAEFGGDAFPFPAARVGTVKIVDNEDRVHQLIVDAKTGKIYEAGRYDVFMDGGM